MSNGLDRQQGTPEDWLLDELADTADEEVEVEMEDAALSLHISRIYQHAHPDSMVSLRWGPSDVGGGGQLRR